MSYDKLLVTEDGDEFPYSESFDNESYYYQISVIFDDRDGELWISKWGSHIAFDDDENWLDFNIPPQELFPDKATLSQADILEYMGTLLERESEGKVIPKDEIDKRYQRFLDATSSKKL